MTRLKSILEEKGYDIRPRYFRPSKQTLMQIQGSQEPMTMYRFHKIVEGKKMMWLDEAIKIAKWLQVDINQLCDESDLLSNQH